MATLQISNRCRYERGLGNIKFNSDTFKIILLDPDFVFDKATHGTYADISAHEISASGEYVVGGYELVVDEAWAQDNVANTAEILWDMVAFTAVNGNFADFKTAAIFDSTHVDDVVIGAAVLEDTVTLLSGEFHYLLGMGYLSS